MSDTSSDIGDFMGITLDSVTMDTDEITTTNTYMDILVDALFRGVGEIDEGDRGVVPEGVENLRVMLEEGKVRRGESWSEGWSESTV